LYIELFILFILTLLFIYFLFNKYINSKYSTDQYGALMQALALTVNTYKIEIFTPQHEALLSKYDLDDDSKTNAQKLFDQVYNDLVKDSSKDIYKNYMSSKIIISLEKYHSLDGILLIIISRLKE